jgi:5-methylcytosine-specific restriction endonuclease McrA
MNVDKKKYCLILSKNFVPLGVEGVKKVMKYLINDQGYALDPETYAQFTFDEWLKHNNEECHKTTVRTEKLWIKIPDIVILKKDYNYQKVERRSISRKKVYERDKDLCVYCKCSLNSTNRTIDHIHPTSKGGAKSDYKNVAACCSHCNGEKGHYTLDILHRSGPHKINDRTGDVIMRREERWQVKTSLSVPRDTVLSHIPKHRWLETWKPFVSFDVY